MGFKRIALGLNADKLIYRSGDVISGICYIDVDQPVTLSSIRVWLIGETLTKWTESETHTSVSMQGASIIPHVSSSSRDMIGRDKHINLAYTVWGNKVAEQGPNKVLAAGSYRYKFRMLIPKDGLRSSFEGSHGVTRYFLKILITRPFPHLNITRYRCFTLICDLDINTPLYMKSCGERKASKQISKVLGLGNAGNLTIVASTDKSGYCAGETIYVTCEFKNESTRTLGKPLAKLVQKCIFHASGKSETSSVCLRAVEGNPLLPGDVRRWVEQPLLIDAVPPSSPHGLINVYYSIELRVNIPFGIDLVLSIPITIGTIPVGISSNPGAITYRDCNKGTFRFTRTESWFPYIDFTPKCAFDNRRSVPPSQRPRPITGPPPTAQRLCASNDGQASSSRTTTTIPTTTVIPGTLEQPVSPQTTDAQNTGFIQASGTEKPPATQPSDQSAVSWQPTGTQISTETHATEDPPTYEEAIAQSMAPLKVHTEQPKESELSEPVTGVCLVVRFPQNMAEEFKATMKRQKQSLYNYGGELIMLAIQPIATAAAYFDDNANLSIAIFRFDDEKQGVEWFATTPELKEHSWLGGCSAYLGKQREHYQPGKRIFSFRDSERDGSKRTNDVEKALKAAYRAFTELKQSHNGTSLLTLAKKDWTILRGDDDLHNTSIIQWSDMGTWIMYIAQVKSEAFKRHIDVVRSTSIVKTNIILQSVDLGWLDDESDRGNPVEVNNPDGTSDDATQCVNGNGQSNSTTQEYQLREGDLSGDLEVSGSTMLSDSGASNNVDDEDSYPELIAMDKPRLVRHILRSISEQENQSSTAEETSSTTEETEPKVLV